jgi:hypothetical protein
MDITSRQQIEHFLEELGRRWLEPSKLYPRDPSLT